MPLRQEFVLGVGGAVARYSSALETCAHSCARAFRKYSCIFSQSTIFSHGVRIFARVQSLAHLVDGQLHRRVGPKQTSVMSSVWTCPRENSWIS